VDNDTQGGQPDPQHSVARAQSGTSGSPDPDPRSAQDVGVIEVANVALRRWKLVAGIPLLAAVVAAVFSLIVRPSFTAATSFVPVAGSDRLQLPSGLGNIAGLASQFGFALGGNPGSPLFYRDLIGSRAIRDQMLLGWFADPRPLGDSAQLIDLLEIDGETLEERLEDGQKRLADLTAADLNRETGVIRVSVETHYPQLAADAANRYVTLLSRFNLETRRSNASERRAFIEQRLVAAEAELRDAEEELKGFLEQNRSYEASPQLRFRYERLQRQVSIKHEVLITLRRQYEEARIQEVNDTPLITVIDPAVAPEKRSSPRRKLLVIIAFVVGAAVGSAAALLRELVERARVRDAAEFAEMTSRWEALKAEVRGVVPWRRRQR